MRKLFLFILSISCIAFGALYFTQSNKHEINSSPNAIIKQAVNLDVPISDAAKSQEAEDLSNQAFEEVQKGDYAQAINITVMGLEKFPKNFNLQSDLAALLGDYSEITPPPLKDKMIKRSKELFQRLITEADNQPKNILYSFKNEYYYRHALYQNQYELGLSRVNYYWGTNEWLTQGFKGYYSQGVGASNYARTLIQEGKKILAFDYAQKAIIAWAQYFSYKNDYYNAYVHYALSLGILGYKEEMLRALTRSASLINKDLSYHEFKEVIDFIENIK